MIRVVLAAGGEAAPVAQSPLLQLGVFITAVGGAVAGVIGSITAFRARSQARRSADDAAEAAKKHATVEERIVNKDEFAEVVEGLRSIVALQREQLDTAARRLDEQEAELRSCREGVQACHDEKVAMRRDFGQERRELHTMIAELGGNPP